MKKLVLLQNPNIGNYILGPDFIQKCKNLEHLELGGKHNQYLTGIKLVGSCNNAYMSNEEAKAKEIGEEEGILKWCKDQNSKNGIPIPIYDEHEKDKVIGSDPNFKMPLKVLKFEYCENVGDGCIRALI